MFDRKEYQKEYSRRYRETHKTEIKLHKKAYTEAHKAEKKAYSKAWRETHKEETKAYRQRPEVKQRANKYYLSHPDEVKAKDVVHYAVRKGKLPRASTKTCARVGCGKQAEHYHHPSYEKQHRLDVLPMCRACHRETHELLKRIAS